MIRFVKWLLYKECEYCNQKNKDTKKYRKFSSCHGYYTDYICSECEKNKDEKFIQGIIIVNSNKVFSK